MSRLEIWLALGKAVCDILTAGLGVSLATGLGQIPGLLILDGQAVEMPTHRNATHRRSHRES